MPAGTSQDTRSPVRLAIRAALLVLLVYAVWTAVRGYAGQDEAHRHIAQAYAFVFEHGEITSHLPCFCGCGKREGHSSLDACFVSRRDAAGRMIARDAHAETCKVCIDVALDAARMRREGASVGEIQRAVETKYTDSVSLRTDTPMLPHGAPGGADHDKR